MPVQMMIADRTLDPPGDFGSEHTDALSTRDMGWLMGWSCDAQEAFDNHLMAYRIGEDRASCCRRWCARMAFFVSHITTDCDLPDAGQVKSSCRPTSIRTRSNPRHPVSHGPQIMPEQGPPLQLERARALEGAVPVIEEAHDEFARIFGRPLRRLDRRVHDRRRRRRLFPAGRARGHGALCDPAHARARRKSRLVRLRTIRPYPTDRVMATLSKFKVVGVVETNMGLGSVSSGGSLYAEVCAALYESPARPLVLSFMAGMGAKRSC